MRVFPLIIITFLYLIIVSIFNYSSYSLLTSSSFGHQYYLIIIYFLSETLAVVCFFIPKKDEIFIDDQLGPLTTNLNATFASTSEIPQNTNPNNSITNVTGINNSNNYNNNTTINYTETIESVRPFVGMKWISFIIPSLIDFISKLCLFNGIKYMKKDLIFRCIIEIIIGMIASKLIYNYPIKCYALFSSFIILCILVMSFIYFQISRYMPSLFSDKEELTGIIFIIIGEILESSQFVIQALFFQTGEPFFYRTLSYEGVYGSILSIFTLFITMLCSCPYNNDNNLDSFCNGDSLEKGMGNFFSDIAKNYKWFIFYFFSCIFNSFIGVFITKHISLIYRMTIESCKIFFYIFMEMFITENYVRIYDKILCIILIFGVFCGLVLCIIIENYKNSLISSINLDKTTII